MGYNSTFSGSLTPSKPIPEELVDRINNGCGCDLRVATTDADDDHDGDIGDVVPDMRDMHGYDITEDVFRVQRLLAQHGIVLNGEIERKGEDDDDFQKIEVVDGKVYSSYGEIVYKNRQEITAKDVTKYAVLVMSNNAVIGWLERPDLVTRKCKISKPLLLNGKPRRDMPPLTAYMTRQRKDALDLVREMKKRSRGKRTYRIVAHEDRL